MDIIKSELEKRLKRKRAEIAALEDEVENFEDRIQDRKDKISTLEATLRNFNPYIT